MPGLSSFYTARTFWRCRLCLIYAMSAVVLLGPLSLYAQDQPIMERSYKELREFNGVQAQAPGPLDRQTAARVIREGVIPDADKVVLDNYIRFKIAELTWIENLEQLPRKRDEMKKQILVQSGRAENSQAHDYITQMLLKELVAIATDDEYHPSARLNAVLIVGKLDQVEPDFQGKGDVPLPAALTALMKIYKDEKQLELVRVGTMYGITRYAQASTSGVGAPVVADLAAIVGSSQPLPGITPAGHAWARRRATQALAALAMQGSGDLNASCVGALAAVLADPKASILARCDAAQAFGYLGKAQLDAAKVDAQKVAMSIAQLIVDIGAQSSNSKLSVTGEALGYYFTVIYTGLAGANSSSGLQNSATGDPKKTIDELVPMVERLRNAIGDRRISDEAARQQVRVRAEEIDRWYKSKVGQGAVTASADTGTRSE